MFRVEKNYKFYGNYAFFHGEECVGSYCLEFEKLTVYKDMPEFGCCKAVDMAYHIDRSCCRQTGVCTDTLVVDRYLPAEGFHPAWDIDKYGPCAGCIYATGEPLLPCAVNPAAYGRGCREYSN